MSILMFLRVCWKLWSIRDRDGVHYFAVESYGVPKATALVGIGRQAYYVSQMAIEARHLVD